MIYINKTIPIIKRVVECELFIFDAFEKTQMEIFASYIQRLPCVNLSSWLKGFL